MPEAQTPADRVDDPAVVADLRATFDRSTGRARGGNTPYLPSPACIAGRAGSG
ncbi:MAG: hypothetical protein AB7H43_00495 [Acidimicrobiia bacterium]